MNTYLVNISDFYLHYALAVLGVVGFLVIIKWGSAWVGKYVCAGLIVSLIAAFYKFALLFILPIATIVIAFTWVFREYKFNTNSSILLDNKYLRIGPIQRIFGALSMLYLATIGIPSILDNYHAAKYHEEEALKWELEEKLESAFKSSTHPHKKFMSFDEWKAQKTNTRDAK
ncbi:MAG: hypothetical protein ACRC8B_03170 [Aeromonas sobria]|uniref:hypothetical protein n=1 Tax=Aeromonas sobria TaxID=646 RepID=UPI003F2DE6E8